MRYGLAVSAVLRLARVAGGCGEEANGVPQVTGERLDLAQQRLDAAGVDDDDDF